MSPYNLLKYVHVVLAIIAVGTNVTYAVWLSRARREPGHLEFALKGIKLLDDRLANPAYGLLFVTGLGLLFIGRLRWTTPWVLTAIVFYLIVIGLGARGFTPLLRRQIETLGVGGPQSPEYQVVASKSLRIGILLIIVVLVIAFLMVTKPQLWG
jgi:uncharacterized membrane protein